MAGYTDSAFRMLCKDFGADVVVTELISADAIAFGKFKIFQNKKQDTRYKTQTIRQLADNIQYSKFKQNRTLVISDKNKSTAELLSFFEAERPVVIQLFGKNPETFAKASKWIWQNIKPDGIDINMGCPARKVVGSDHGAALLKNPTLACEIVKAVKENCDCPVSVKTRLGWENDDEILAFVPFLIDAGIDAITIHGRTYKDGFKGKARWENIYKIKKMVGDKLIVIGNGDIKDSSQFTARLSDGQVVSSQLGASLDGIAIGRASFGKPWIFGQNTDNSIQITELQKTILRHAKLAFDTKGEHGIVEFRKHLLAYLKGFPEAKSFREEAVKVETLEEITKIVSKLSQT